MLILIELLPKRLRLIFFLKQECNVKVLLMLAKALKKHFQLDPKTKSHPDPIHSKPKWILTKFLELKKSMSLRPIFLCEMPIFLKQDLMLLQLNFSVFMITPSLAYPVSIDFNTFLIVSVTILVLGGVASKISSSVVTKELVGKA